LGVFPREPALKSPNAVCTPFVTVAARSGWQVVGIYEDAGISGAKGRDKRPGFDGLLKDATARKINMIAAWSVDRLGSRARFARV
jgi:DNA invertase Pin-like site-specific DNA recombinase